MFAIYSKNYLLYFFLKLEEALMLFVLSLLPIISFQFIIAYS